MIKDKLSLPKVMDVIYSSHGSHGYGARKNHIGERNGHPLCDVKKRFPNLLFSSSPIEIDFNVWIADNVDDTLCKNCLRIVKEK